MNYQDLVQQNSEDLDPVESDRGFKGIWIPKEIYLNKSLSWSEKILLIEIDSLSSTEKGCFASNAYFANFLGIHHTNISTMISKLKTLNLIEQVSFNGRKRIIKSCPQNFNDKSFFSSREGQRQHLPKGKGSICQKAKAQTPTHNVLINSSINSKEKTNKKAAETSSPASDALPSVRALCVFLLQKIREKNPGFKKPNAGTWEKDFQDMITQDKRDPQKIKAVIEWAFSQKDDFWPTSMLSPKTLNKLFDRAVMRMNIKKMKEVTPEMISQRKAKANYIEGEFNRMNDLLKRGRSINALSNHIEFCSGGQSKNGVMVLSYADARFKELLEIQLRKWSLESLI